MWGVGRCIGVLTMVALLSGCPEPPGSDGKDSGDCSGPELCDDIDNDCDGFIDEDDAEDASTWYADNDGDGYGDISAPTNACLAPSGFVFDSNDCDDTDANVNPGAVEICDEADTDEDCSGAADDEDANTDPSTQVLYYLDMDEDGYGAEADAGTLYCDPPDEYVEDATDCDDNESTAYPGAEEICDELDNDCNGETDEGVTSTFYLDYDGDGEGDASRTTEGCTVPSGYVTNSDDCDDTEAGVNTSAAEVCNDIDDDCDSLIDDEDSSVDTSTGSTFYADTDSDGYGDSASTIRACGVPSGYAENDADCDDADTSTNPGAVEICDEADTDEDCSGAADDSDTGVDTGTHSTFYADSDSDGYGDTTDTVEACDAPSGYVSDDSDCDDIDASINPGEAEVCDTADTDEDCNGAADDDDVGVDTSTQTLYYPDGDSDGYGDEGDAGTWYCDPPSSYITDNTDCDDARSDVNPGEVEVCDTRDADEDCSGAADDDDSGVDASTHSTFYADSDSDGYGDSASTLSQCDQPSGYVSDDSDCDDSDASINPDEAETAYDGIDQDCDGADLTDVDGDGYDSTAVSGGTDCDDSDAAVNPGAFEIWYDGVDQDCDSASDYDRDTDGYDTTAYGGSDCDDNDASINPDEAETAYDGIDQDCDGADLTDVDGDGYDSTAVSGGTDCNDSNAAVNPGEVEVCNNEIDDDCDDEASECVLDSTIDLTTDADVYLSGADRLGVSVAGDIDLNGDEIDDVLMGAPGDNAVYILYGAMTLSGSMSTSDLEEISNSTTFGEVLATGCDFDGDNYDDVAVLDSDAYIMYGPITAGYSVSSSTDFFIDHFRPGEALSCGGDDEALPDLLLGFHTEATAYLVHNSDIAASGSVTLSSTADLDISGSSGSSQLGRQLLMADIDADGDDELIIAAPEASSNGEVYIFENSYSGSLSESDADYTITGESSGDYFGSAIEVGDLNGDEEMDLIISSRERTNTYSRDGASYIITGPISADIDMSSSGSYSAYIYGNSLDAFCGDDLAVTDINNDTHDDLLVGSYGSWDAYFFYGPVTSGSYSESDADSVLSGGEHFSYGVDGAGDVNNDDYFDLIIGAYGDDEAYIVFGTGM